MLTFPLKSPRRFPLKGLITGRMCGELIGNLSAKDTPERVDDGWGLLLRRMPPEREKMTGGCAGKRLGKVGGKVAEIEFFEI